MFQALYTAVRDQEVPIKALIELGQEYTSESQVCVPVFDVHSTIVVLCGITNPFSPKFLIVAVLKSVCLPSLFKKYILPTF